MLLLTNSNYPTIFYAFGFDGFLILALAPPLKAEASPPPPPPLLDPDGLEGYTADLEAALIIFVQFNNDNLRITYVNLEKEALFLLALNIFPKIGAKYLCVSQNEVPISTHLSRFFLKPI